MQVDDPALFAPLDYAGIAATVASQLKKQQQQSTIQNNTGQNNNVAKGGGVSNSQQFVDATELGVHGIPAWRRQEAATSRKQQLQSLWGKALAPPLMKSPAELQEEAEKSTLSTFLSAMKERHARQARERAGLDPNPTPGPQSITGGEASNNDPAAAARGVSPISRQTVSTAEKRSSTTAKGGASGKKSKAQAVAEEAERLRLEELNRIETEREEAEAREREAAFLANRPRDMWVELAQAVKAEGDAFVGHLEPHVAWASQRGEYFRERPEKDYLIEDPLGEFLDPNTIPNPHPNTIDAIGYAQQRVKMLEQQIGYVAPRGLHVIGKDSSSTARKAPTNDAEAIDDAEFFKNLLNQHGAAGATPSSQFVCSTTLVDNKARALETAHAELHDRDVKLKEAEHLAKLQTKSSAAAAAASTSLQHSPKPPGGSSRGIGGASTRTTVVHSSKAIESSDPSGVYFRGCHPLRTYKKVVTLWNRDTNKRRLRVHPSPHGTIALTPLTVGIQGSHNRRPYDPSRALVSGETLDVEIAFTPTNATAVEVVVKVGHAREIEKVGGVDESTLWSDFDIHVSCTGAKPNLILVTHPKNTLGYYVNPTSKKAKKGTSSHNTTTTTATIGEEDDDLLFGAAGDGANNNNDNIPEECLNHVDAAYFSKVNPGFVAIRRLEKARAEGPKEQVGSGSKSNNNSHDNTALSGSVYSSGAESTTKATSRSANRQAVSMSVALALQKLDILASETNSIISANNYITMSPCMVYSRVVKTVRFFNSGSDGHFQFNIHCGITTGKMLKETPFRVSPPHLKIRSGDFADVKLIFEPREEFVFTSGFVPVEGTYFAGLKETIAKDILGKDGVEAVNVTSESTAGKRGLQTKNSKSSLLQRKAGGASSDGLQVNQWNAESIKNLATTIAMSDATLCIEAWLDHDGDSRREESTSFSFPVEAASVLPRVSVETLGTPTPLAMTNTSCIPPSSIDEIAKRNDEKKSAEKPSSPSSGVGATSKKSIVKKTALTHTNNAIPIPVSRSISAQELLASCPSLRFEDACEQHVSSQQIKVLNAGALPIDFLWDVSSFQEELGGRVGLHSANSSPSRLQDSVIGNESTSSHVVNDRISTDRRSNAPPSTVQNHRESADGCNDDRSSAASHYTEHMSELRGSNLESGTTDQRTGQSVLSIFPSTGSLKPNSVTVFTVEFRAMDIRKLEGLMRLVLLGLPDPALALFDKEERIATSSDDSTDLRKTVGPVPFLSRVKPIPILAPPVSYTEPDSHAVFAPVVTSSSPKKSNTLHNAIGAATITMTGLTLSFSAQKAIQDYHLQANGALAKISAAAMDSAISTTSPRSTTPTMLEWQQQQLFGCGLWHVYPTAFAPISIEESSIMSPRRDANGVADATLVRQHAMLLQALGHDRGPLLGAAIRCVADPVTCVVSVVPNILRDTLSCLTNCEMKREFTIVNHSSRDQRFWVDPPQGDAHPRSNKNYEQTQERKARKLNNNNGWYSPAQGSAEFNHEIREFASLTFKPAIGVIPANTTVTVSCVMILKTAGAHTFDIECYFPDLEAPQQQLQQKGKKSPTDASRSQHLYISTSAVGPAVSLSSKVVDLGVIPLGEEGEGRITVTNNNPVPVTFSLIDPIEFIPPTGNSVTEEEALPSVEELHARGLHAPGTFVCLPNTCKLRPGAAVDITIYRRGVVAEHISEQVHVVVQNGQITPIEVNALVQRSSASIVPDIVSFGKAFRDIPAEREIRLSNHSPVDLEYRFSVVGDAVDCTDGTTMSLKDRIPALILPPPGIIAAGQRSIPLRIVATFSGSDRRAQTALVVMTSPQLDAPIPVEITCDEVAQLECCLDVFALPDEGIKVLRGDRYNSTGGGAVVPYGLGGRGSARSTSNKNPVSRMSDRSAVDLNNSVYSFINGDASPSSTAANGDAYYPFSSATEMQQLRLLQPTDRFIRDLLSNIVEQAITTYTPPSATRPSYRMVGFGDTDDVKTTAASQPSSPQKGGEGGAVTTTGSVSSGVGPQLPDIQSIRNAPLTKPFCPTMSIPYAHLTDTRPFAATSALLRIRNVTGCVASFLLTPEQYYVGVSRAEGLQRGLKSRAMLQGGGTSNDSAILGNGAKLDILGGSAFVNVNFQAPPSRPSEWMSGTGQSHNMIRTNFSDTNPRHPNSGDQPNRPNPRGGSNPLTHRDNGGIGGGTMTNSLRSSNAKHIVVPPRLKPMDNAFQVKQLDGRQSEEDQEAERLGDACEILLDGKGCGILAENAYGMLRGFEHQDISLTLMANIPGRYMDKLTLLMDNMPPVSVDVDFAVRGRVVVLDPATSGLAIKGDGLAVASSGANDGSGSSSSSSRPALPRLSLPSLVAGMGTVSRRLRLTNRCPRDVEVRARFVQADQFFSIKLMEGVSFKVSHEATSKSKVTNAIWSSVGDPNHNEDPTVANIFLDNNQRNAMEVHLDCPQKGNKELFGEATSIKGSPAASLRQTPRNNTSHDTSSTTRKSTSTSSSSIGTCTPSGFVIKALESAEVVIEYSPESISNTNDWNAVLVFATRLANTAFNDKFIVDEFYRRYGEERGFVPFNRHLVPAALVTNAKTAKSVNVRGVAKVSLQVPEINRPGVIVGSTLVSEPEDEVAKAEQIVQSVRVAAAASKAAGSPQEALNFVEDCGGDSSDSEDEWELARMSQRERDAAVERAQRRRSTRSAADTALNQRAKENRIAKRNATLERAEVRAYLEKRRAEAQEESEDYFSPIEILVTAKSVVPKLTADPATEVRFPICADSSNFTADRVAVTSHSGLISTHKNSRVLQITNNNGAALEFDMEVGSDFQGLLENGNDDDDDISEDDSNGPLGDTVGYGAVRFASGAYHANSKSGSSSKRIQPKMRPFFHLSSVKLLKYDDHILGLAEGTELIQPTGHPNNMNTHHHGKTHLEPLTSSSTLVASKKKSTPTPSTLVESVQRIRLLPKDSLYITIDVDPASAQAFISERVTNAKKVANAGVIELPDGAAATAYNPGKQQVQGCLVVRFVNTIAGVSSVSTATQSFGLRATLHLPYVIPFPTQTLFRPMKTIQNGRPESHFIRTIKLINYSTVDAPYIIQPIPANRDDMGSASLFGAGSGSFGAPDPNDIVDFSKIRNKETGEQETLGGMTMSAVRNKGGVNTIRRSSTATTQALASMLSRVDEEGKLHLSKINKVDSLSRPPQLAPLKSTTTSTPNVLPSSSSVGKDGSVVMVSAPSEASGTNIFGADSIFNAPEQDVAGHFANLQDKINDPSRFVITPSRGVVPAATAGGVPGTLEVRVQFNEMSRMFFESAFQIICMDGSSGTVRPATLLPPATFTLRGESNETELV